MKLEEVIEQFREGQTIRRTWWDTYFSINKLSDDICHECDGILGIEDILSDDWEISE